MIIYIICIIFILILCIRRILLYRRYVVFYFNDVVMKNWYKFLATKSYFELLLHVTQCIIVMRYISRCQFSTEYLLYSIAILKLSGRDPLWGLQYIHFLVFNTIIVKGLPKIIKEYSSL